MFLEEGEFPSGREGSRRDFYFLVGGEVIGGCGLGRWDCQVSVQSEREYHRLGVGERGVLRRRTRGFLRFRCCHIPEQPGGEEQPFEDEPVQ